MGLTPHDIGAAPLATEPLFMLINHHYLMRQQPGLAQTLDREQHDPLRRRYTAAEMSLGLVVNYVMSELLYPPPPDKQVALAERLGLALGTLEALIANAMALDTVMPRLSNQVQRQYLMPAPLASLLVQTTLVVVLSALADESKLIIVSTPRPQRRGVLIVIETDAAGLDAGINAALKQCLTEQLAKVGGALTIMPTDHQSWSANIWIPDGAQTASEGRRHVDA